MAESLKSDKETVNSEAEAVALSSWKQRLGFTVLPSSFIWLAGLFVLLIVLWFGRQLPFFSYPLKSYEILSPVEKVQSQQVERVMQRFVGQSFWSLSLKEVQSQLVAIEWVMRADVSRVWPNRLQIELIEQAPVARWGDNGLINHLGDVFYPHELGDYVRLIRIDAPLEVRHQALEETLQMRKSLLMIDKMLVSARFDKDKSWQVVTADGLVVYLPQDWQSILQRFVKAYAQLKPQDISKAVHFDLRYSNGFSVSYQKTQ